MGKQWITVYRHKEHEIQALRSAKPSEIGYRIKGIEGERFNTVHEATQAIDRLDNKR